MICYREMFCKPHILSLICLILLSACVTTTHRSESANANLWQFTNPPEGFEFAKRERKPMLLYWGAVWCPPCTELKSQLFTRAEFAELAQQVVTVYLDGDSEAAQSYGDKLKVSSYPTMLLLDNDGKEVMRIIEPLSMEEFRSLFQSALMKLKPEQERIALVLEGKGSEEDFRVLSLADASDLLNHDEALLRRLAEKAPSHMQRERSLLLLKALTYAMEKPSEVNGKNKKWAIDALSYILSDSAHSLPAFFSYRAKDVKEYLGKKIFEEKLEKKWLERMAQERMSSSRSITSRMWAYLPEIELATGMSVERKAQLQTEILTLFGEAKGHYEKHAATSAVGDLIALLGDSKKARELLTKALKDPEEKTPWYFEASLAQIEADSGHVEDALEWSERSRKSARGTATNIQWEAMNILMNLKHRKENHAHIATLVSELFDSLFAAKDGFLGRNRNYATKVAKALQPELSYYSAIVDKYSARCKKLEESSKNLCADYFNQMEIASSNNLSH